MAVNVPSEYVVIKFGAVKFQVFVIQGGVPKYLLLLLYFIYSAFTEACASMIARTGLRLINWERALSGSGIR